MGESKRTSCWSGDGLTMTVLLVMKLWLTRDHQKAVVEKFAGCKASVAHIDGHGPLYLRLG